MKKPVSRWIAEVQHDENGDAMVIFPPEFCEQTDQREGDLYDIKAIDGKIVMTFIVTVHREDVDNNSSGSG